MADRIAPEPATAGGNTTGDYPAEQSARPSRIVVVNDDPTQLRLAATVLQRSGFAVIACQSAEDALHRIAECPKVDLVVTDLHMRGIDGWRFCQLLRSPDYPAMREVPILVMSATYSGVDAEQITSQLGANAFLPAPYTPAILLEFVGALLTGRQPRERARVLLVDDDADTAKQMQLAFEARGYAVMTAPTIERGWQLYRAFSPHAAVLRHRRPDFLAEELLDEIKQPGSSSVALIITSEDDAHLALNLSRRGADAFVRQPVASEFLVDLCETARRQRALLRVEELLEQRTRQLQHSEARFRTLFEALPEIVIVCDQGWRILQVNPAGAARLEYPTDALVGRSLADIVTHDRTRPPASYPTAPAAGDSRGFETTYLTRLGGRIAVDVDESFIIFNGEPAILTVARDITARKDAERQRADFVSMMAHDIRNPLGVVLGYAEMLREVGELNTDQEDLVRRMEMNAQSVVSLLSNYLDLSRIEAQCLNLAQRPVRLDDLVRRVAQRYESEASRRRINFVFASDQGLGDIGGDPLALERVFANLIHNALKFTPDGGTVQIGISSMPGEARATVSDNGPGIAPENIPVIFERFGRINAAGFGTGTGLGLFIAKAIVEAQGGHIEVRSSVGRGSAFTVSLPVLAPAQVDGDGEPQRATA